MELSGVLKYLETELEKENPSEERRRIIENLQLATTPNISEFLLELINTYKRLEKEIFDELLKPKCKGRPRKKPKEQNESQIEGEPRKQTKFAMAKFMFVYHEQASLARDGYFDSFKNLVPNNSSIQLQSVISFYISKVFEYGQLINQNKLWNDTGNVNINSVKMMDESLSAILKLGGGGLGGIRKVCVKGKKKNLSTRQVIEQHQFFKMTVLFKMTKIEKENHLPIDLKVLDEGGLLFPKLGFLPFVERVNNETRSYANSKCYNKYGVNLIKKTIEHVISLRSELRDLYDDGIQKEKIEVVSPEISDKFFLIWLRKMVHCRIQEFIGSYCKMQKEKKTDVSLRDNLLVLSVRESKSKEKLKHTKSKIKEKIIKKKKCTKRKFNDTDTFQASPADSVDIDISSPNKPVKISKLRSSQRISARVLLKDFI